MTYADYAYGPLHEILMELLGDNPPSDPVALRMILARCLQEVIALQSKGASA